MSHFAPAYSLLKLKLFLCLHYVMEGRKVPLMDKTSLKASKGKEVIVSPVTALVSGSLRLHVWPLVPQAQKFNFMESISDLSLNTELN